MTYLFLINASLSVFLKIVFSSPASCLLKRHARMGCEPPNIGCFMLVPGTFVSFVGSYMYLHVKQDDLIELLQCR